MSDNAEVAPELTKTVPLSRPLPTSLGRLPSLTMREPTVDDHIDAEDATGGGSAGKMERHLFALLCGLAPSEIGKMPMRDYKAMQTVYRSFL